MTDTEILDTAEAGGYSLGKGTRNGKHVWAWSHDVEPAPSFGSRREAIDWMARQLSRQRVD